MSDVENNSSTTSRPTTTTTRTSSSTFAELSTPIFRSTTPMSSSPTTASTPSLSTPSPLLPIPLSTSPPSTTMTTSTTSVPSTTIPTTPTTTTTISITITPTSTITTTTSISIPPTSAPTLPPISSSTSSTTSSTSTSTPTSMISRLSSGTYTGPSTPPTPPLPPTPFTGSRPIPGPEAMLSSPRITGPVSTFSTTVYISTTDSRGSSIVYAPSFITSTTLMDMGGTPTTSTAIIANPTLNTDTSSPSTFFQNRGAVAGVFTLVGIAVISITIWIILFIRRRRRELGLEQESTISALLYEAGIDRISIEPESSSSHHSRYGSAEFLAIPMPNSNPERHRRSTSGLLERRLSIMPDAYHDRGQYDPFIQYGPRNSRDGYPDMPSPTSPHPNIPPPSAYAPYRDRTSNDGMVEVGPALPVGAAIVHTRYSHHNSRTSFEPSHQWRNGPQVPGQGPLVLDAINLSNGRASQTPSTDASSASTSKPSYLASLTHPNFYATNTSSRSGLLINGREDHGSEVNMLDGNGEIKKPDILAESEVSTTEDEMELQKPVLAVRNLPDAASTVSLS